MSNYDFFGYEQDFNNLDYRNNLKFDPFDSGSKELAADIGLTELSQSPIALNLRKQHPK